MPYRGPKSRARQAVDLRDNAVKDGENPDGMTAVQAEILSKAVENDGILVRGGKAAGSISYGSAATRGYVALKAAASTPVRHALPKYGLTADAIAKRLARAVAHMDSDDPVDRQYGARVMSMVLKIRGDLVTAPNQGAATPAPQNMNVLIQVLHELRQQQPKLTDARSATIETVAYPTQDVVVETDSDSDNPDVST